MSVHEGLSLEHSPSDGSRITIRFVSPSF